MYILQPDHYLHYLVKQGSMSTDELDIGHGVNRGRIQGFIYIKQRGNHIPKFFWQASKQKYGLDVAHP